MAVYQGSTATYQSSRPKVAPAPAYGPAYGAMTPVPYSGGRVNSTTTSSSGQTPATGYVRDKFAEETWAREHENEAAKLNQPNIKLAEGFHDSAAQQYRAGVAQDMGLEWDAEKGSIVPGSAQAKYPGAFTSGTSSSGGSGSSAPRYGTFAASTPSRDLLNTYGTATPLIPGEDLRGTQLLPSAPNNQYNDQALAEIASAVLSGKKSIAGTDVTGARALYGDARGEVDQATIGDHTFTPSQEADRSRALIMQALEALSSTPDREQLALRTVNLAREQSNPQFDQDLRKVGQKAAAFGRLGAGMTTSELGDVASNREKRLEQLTESVSIQSAEQKMADLLARLQSTSQVGGQLRAEDLQKVQHGLTVDQAKAALALNRGSAIAGLGDRELGVAQTVRRDAESDRGYDLDYDTSAANLALNRAGAIGTVDSRLFGQDTSRRAETRDERDWQNTLAKQAQEEEHRKFLAQLGLDQFDLDKWKAEEDIKIRRAAVAAA